MDGQMDGWMDQWADRWTKTPALLALSGTRLVVPSVTFPCRAPVVRKLTVLTVLGGPTPQKLFLEKLF